MMDMIHKRANACMWKGTGKCIWQNAGVILLLSWLDEWDRAHVGCGICGRKPVGPPRLLLESYQENQELYCIVFL